MEYNAADIIERLEQIRGNKLAGRDSSEIEVWEKGRHLATTVSTSGWAVAVGLLQGYVIKSVELLSATDPGDKDNVLTNHVISFVAGRLLQIFEQDVQSWVESSRATPSVIKQTIDSQTKLEL